MRGTFLLIPLLFLGCWILTYRTLQPAEPVGNAAGLPPATPTTSLALRLPADTPGPGHAGPSEVATALGTPAVVESVATATSTPVPTAPPTDTPSPPASPTLAGTTYVVKGGDTLSSIAKSTSVSIDAIASANHMKPPYPLRVGDRLTIPAH